MRYWIILTTILLCISPVSSDDKVVTFATCNWEPFYGKDLPNNGFFTEIISEIFASEGYKTEFTFMAWSEAVQLVKENRYNAILGAYHTFEREKYFHYPLPVFDIKVIFISRRELNITYDGNLKNLQGFIIGVSEGYVNNPEFDAATYLTKKAYSGPEELIDKIVAKEVDVIVISSDVAQYILKKKYPTQLNSLKALGPSLARRQLFTPISKKHPEHQKLVDDFNRGLRKFIKEGRIQEIYLKHTTGK